MENSLLLSYQIEYETTDITLTEIQQKYSIPSDKTTHWKKRTEPRDVILVPGTTTSDNPVPKTTISDKNIVTTEDSHEDLMADIDTFKKEVVAKALDFIKNHAQYAEVKELKDMVAIVDSVEKSYKDTNTGPTINVLIQNLTERLKDDC